MKPRRAAAARLWLAAAVGLLGPPGALGARQARRTVSLRDAALPATCQPPCENGGVCLPNAIDDGVLAPQAAWVCSCPEAWVGPTCSTRPGSAGIGGPGFSVAGAEGAAVIPSPSASQGSQGLSPFEERRHQLQSRIQALRSKLQTLTGSGQSRDAGAANALYRALCGAGPGPCPLQLQPGEIHLGQSSSSAIRLTVVASGPKLEAIRAEVERQLGDAASPLRGAGGVQLVDRPSAIDVWLRRPSDRGKTKMSASEALVAFRAARGGLGGRVQSPAPAAPPPVPEGPPPANLTVSEVTGITQNQAGDVKGFVYSCIINVLVIALCILITNSLRKSYPLVYQGECKRVGDLPASLSGWMRSCMALTTDEVVQFAGLDQGMMVEFTNLSMQILAVVGIPLILVLCPLHFYFGGADLEDGNHLSFFGMGNVKQGSWLYWVHAFVTWYVVVAVSKMVTWAQENFLPRRFDWIKNMPYPRATTVLVEGLPMGKNTEEGVRKYFDEVVFGRPVVKRAFVVKNVTELNNQLERLEDMNTQLARVGRHNKSALRDSAVTDDANVNALVEERDQLEAQIATLRHEINEKDFLNSRNAFVTFERRRDKIIAEKVFSKEDHELISVEIPPDPADIIWQDLLADPIRSRLMKVFGYLLILALFLSFMPMVITITLMAHMRDEDTGSIITDYLGQGYYQMFASTWNGMIGSLALTALMSFVPTALCYIFSYFFILKAEAWLQYRIQQWFFYFQIIYVLLVTAVGTSMLKTITELAKNPMSVLSLLAGTIPNTTHFYLGYMAVQWGSHAITITRYVNLFKFMAWRQIYTNSKAKVLSEPEDQDYHGIGSRFARFSLLLVIPLFFCTLSPMITIVGIINFAIAKPLYGYLVVYAETKKADLGGTFWYQGLKHTQKGLYLYVALMTGVLKERASTWHPSAIAASSLVYLWVSYDSFKKDIHWETLDFDEADATSTELELAQIARGERIASYRQPELQNDTIEEQEAGVLGTAKKLGERIAAPLRSLTSMRNLA